MGNSLHPKSKPIALRSVFSIGACFGGDMTAVRKTDRQSCTYFRTDRFTQESGEWFFYTREGTVEGPCDCLMEAKIRLENYIKVMESGLLPENAGF